MAEEDDDDGCEHCGEYDDDPLYTCGRCGLDMCSDCINLHACIDDEEPRDDRP